MKFNDSEVITLPIRDKTLRLHQDNSTVHVGTSVWQSSLVLSKFLERWAPPSPNPNPYSNLFNFPSTRPRAVELGSGCGGAGMSLHLLNVFSDVILTDIAAVMPALKYNLKKNKETLGRNLKTAVVNWKSEEQIAALNPPFEAVLAADVVYLEENVGDLVAAMGKLVAEEGVVLLGYQVRCVDADRVFWERVGEVFVVEKVKKEDLHPDFAFEENDVFIFRKKKKTTCPSLDPGVESNNIGTTSWTSLGGLESGHQS